MNTTGSNHPGFAMEGSTLASLLERAAGHDRCVRFVDRKEQSESFPYAEIHRRALRVADGLRSAGLSPGDRVGIVLPTGVSFYDTFFGTVLAGAVPVPLYPPVRLGRLDEYHARTAGMLRSVQARMVVTDRRVRRILGITLERAGLGLGCVTADALLDSSTGSGTRRLPLGCDELAFIQMSSGTTRAPKPVRLTHRQVLSNVQRIVDAIVGNYPEDEQLTHAGVSWLPLYHDMGLVGCVLVALARPGDLTLIPPEVFVARPATWLRTISRYRGTVSPAPNFAYALCTERIRDDELKGVDLSSWRIALNGAEPVTPSVLQRFVERFSRFGLRPEALTPVYGLAEATLAVTFSPLRSRFRWTCFDRDKLAGEGTAEVVSDGLPLVSLGAALPGFDVRIAAHDGTRLPAGRCGRVWVKGPSLMQGYHGMARESAECLHDGWLDTGDLGFIHEGQLYLHGRSKDIIILRGRNHAPQTFEQVLDGVEGVRAGCCAAIGVSDGGDTERLVLLVERARARTDQAWDDGEIAGRVRRLLSAQLGIPPDRVEVLEPGTLPRTSSGKIRRAEAKRRYEQKMLTAPRPVTRLRMVGELIRSGLSLVRARRALSHGS